MDCYCISGLGADQRIFSRLNLPGVTLRYLPWLLPGNDEPIAQYAGRMKADINHNAPILIGVSFGGMMAIEIAKSFPSATVIMISSIRQRQQRPAWMTGIGRLHLERLVSRRNHRRELFRKWLAPLEDYFLGVEGKEDAALCRDFRNKVDRQYVPWAIDHIFHWENEWIPSSFYQLHGGRDRIFPLGARDVTHFVPDGGHLMVHNRPEVVGQRINAILANLRPPAPDAAYAPRN